MPAGTLRLRPVRGIDLKSVQRIGKQDPYVKIRLLPGRVEKKTKYVNNGGRNPVWDPTAHCSVMNFDLTQGALSAPSARLAIEVYDKESIQRDRLIGKADYLINNDLLSTVDEKYSMIEIFDSKGKGAGKLELSIMFLSPESLAKDKAAASIQARFRGFRKRSVFSTSSSSESQNGDNNHFVSKCDRLPARASNLWKKLKSVQRLGKQDPYVRVTLDPSSQQRKTKCHDNGGKNPKWNVEKHESMLMFDITREIFEAQDAKIHLELFDGEMVMQDRFIAKGTHLLAVDFKNPGREIVVPLQVLDSKDKPAGVLEFSVQYVPAPDSLKVIPSPAIPQRMGEDVAASRIQNLFRKKSTIRASVPGKVETLVAATATSKLTIQPIRGLKLKKVQKLGTQDPYVRATVIPANKTQRTLCVNNGGRNPEWDQSDHNSALSFDLMPQPDDAHILVEVFDAEALTKDRLIGSAQYPLRVSRKQV